MNPIIAKHLAKRGIAQSKRDYAKVILKRLSKK
jgi:hypothetical protein